MAMQLSCTMQRCMSSCMVCFGQRWQATSLLLCWPANRYCSAACRAAASSHANSTCCWAAVHVQTTGQQSLSLQDSCKVECVIIFIQQHSLQDSTLVLSTLFGKAAHTREAAVLAGPRRCCTAHLQIQVQGRRAFVIAWMHGCCSGLCRSRYNVMACVAPVAAPVAA